MIKKSQILKRQPEAVIVRKYCSGDRQAVRTLCCDTAYFGEPCEAFFTDRELLADLIMKYHTDCEPQHTWIAEYKGEIIGYISACFDSTTYGKVMLFKIVPISLGRALMRGKIWSMKTYKMIIYSLKAFFLNETKLVDADDKEFPVNIHQNIKKDFRGKGIGSKLLTALLNEVDRDRIAGIRFRALRQQCGFPFFEKCGFKQFGCKRVKSWEDWLKKTPLYFMEYRKKCYTAMIT